MPEVSSTIVETTTSTKPFAEVLQSALQILLQTQAQMAVQRAKDILADKSKSETDLRIAEAKLKRALLRSNIAAAHTQR